MRSSVALVPLVQLVAVLLALVACGGGAPAEERSLAALVDAGRYEVAAGDEADGEAPLTLPGEPRVETVRIDHERRPAVLLPEGVWRWRTTVPERARLQLGVGAPGAPPATAAGGLEATATLLYDGGREVLDVARSGGSGKGEAAGWLDLGADLSDYAGREVVLEIEARRLGAGGGAGAAGPAEDLLAWGPAVLATGAGTGFSARGGAAERPNVLFVVIDTLRHDHVGAYGYERDTTPEIDRRLAARGAVVEDAYSQAPWTLPSVVSFLTGRFPGEILGDDPATFGIPEGVPSLAEEMAELGYRTAGFIANPTLHDGNGLGRGFETFHSPQGMAALELHADSVNRRAIPWLRAHRDEPFFLYVHYIDPHDPYWNPDLVDGRSPWFEDPGGPSGRWVHGVYGGKIPIDDLDRTVEHFTALYDSEIRYVDRALGELLDAIPEEVLADTLVVLTSDHGEELYDHGGWKHGHTLYEDQIHVPLIVRWDGRIPEGIRLPGTVRLLDLTPTVLEAAGGEAPATWQGRSLLPALTGGEPLPRVAAYAENLQVGPLRAAAVADGRKLILFNETEPFDPANPLQEHIYRLDLERLAPVEMYDLAADPGERTNLATVPEGGTGDEEAGRLERLAAILYHRLDRTLPGVRALTDALAPGARLSGELTFESAPAAAVPLFLGPDGRVEVEGATVRFEIVGGPMAQGFRLTGAPGALVRARLALDGEPLPEGRLRYGEGRPFGGRRVPPGALETTAFPGGAGRARGGGAAPGLLLWSPSGDVSLDTETSEETLERLKALGYVE